ncbi:TetR/AcrR family transcriptional regulator [Streptomyces anulatus]
MTMSQIAKKVGIGRAALYKYFPGVEAILSARLDRQNTWGSS